MQERSYQEVLDFFREVLKEEIGSAIYFFNSDMDDMNNEKQKKFIKSTYSKNQYEAVEWASSLEKKVQEKLKILFQFYTSDAFRYFFRRLEEGENIKQGERINFELTAINENTGQRTKLISANPDDNIDNNFQEWIMENCSEINNEK